ncbi:ASCH domain-containing protein [Candidatus Bathyarchaeota archaeon]|nr:ASCH domain-containing protein [Candidatus Bathyarchaeota archaeon]MBL7079283.1 ASCH domain-containing protein [Candidatus Bathyarchaeota archaeon]
MTLLFKKTMLPKIHDGTKTATRRPIRPMVKEGGKYRLKTELFKAHPDSIQVGRLYPQSLGEMTQADAQMEGYSTLQEFQEEWVSLFKAYDPEQTVWVVEFRYLGLLQTV